MVKCPVGTTTVSGPVSTDMLAQHFTPPAVARFAWEAVCALAGTELAPDARIIDPAAGEGALLAAAARCQTTGIEIDRQLAQKAGRVAEKVHAGDGLLWTFAEEVDGVFDCVLANPPFGKLGPILPLLGRDAQNIIRQRFSVFNIMAIKNLATLPVELLFIERALQMVRPRGWLSLILPEGFFANARLQKVRDWLGERAEVRAVVALPADSFRRKGLNARTALVVLQQGRGRASARIIGPRGEGHVADLYLQDALRAIKGRVRRQGVVALARVSPRARVGRRWDPQYWQGYRALEKLARRVQLVPLGDYIRHLTYGPIVTGSRPSHVDSGVPVIRQGDIVETGLDEDDLLRVAPRGVHDPPRSRVCDGDLLLPRSGVGALGRNRLAVYLGGKPANVGCFVDLIRLEGLNPFYAWFFFKTRHGREQIAACANGVGTPNISFGEIRALKIPVLPCTEQLELERRYRREVWPLHRRRRESEAVRLEGERRFRAIVAGLEDYLGGL